MIYIVEINRPFRDSFGSKISFTLPKDIEEIKSILLRVDSVMDIEGVFPPPLGDVDFELINFSLLLNNGDEQVLSDAIGQVSLFDNSSGDWQIGRQHFEYSPFKEGRVIINKKLIKNSVHYAVFKMEQRLIDYMTLDTPINHRQLENYLRKDLKLMLYVEAA